MEKDEIDMRYEFKNNKDYEKDRIKKMTQYLNEVGAVSEELNREIYEIKEKNNINGRKEK